MHNAAEMEQRARQAYADGRIDEATLEEILASNEEDYIQPAESTGNKKKPAAPAVSNSETTDNGVRHSYSKITEVEANDIGVSPKDGSLVVNINSRSSGLHKYPKGQWAKQLAKAIRSELSGKSIYADDGDIITVTNRGVSELTYGKRTQDLYEHGKGTGDFSALSEKQIASEHVASLIALSRYAAWSENDDPRDLFKKDGLCHRTVLAYIDGVPHSISILTALNGDNNHPDVYGEKFYDIENIEEIKHQITSSTLSGTGIGMPVDPHKIKMAEGLSDKLSVAQKNRIVNNRKLRYSVGDKNGKTAIQIALEEAQRKKQANHSFSRRSSAEQVDDQAEGTPAKVELTRENIPSKAKTLLVKAENALRRKLEKALSVPKGVSRESLKPIVEQISTEYLRSGTVSQETVDRLFDEAYEKGVVEDREFYDQYKHIKDHLRL